MTPFPKKKKLVPIRRYTPKPRNRNPRQVNNNPAFVRFSISIDVIA